MSTHVLTSSLPALRSHLDDVRPAPDAIDRVTGTTLLQLSCAVVSGMEAEADDGSQGKSLPNIQLFFLSFKVNYLFFVS